MFNNKKGISLIILVLIIVLVIAVGTVAIVLVMNKDNSQNQNESFETENNIANNEPSNIQTEDTKVQTDEYEEIAWVGSRDITINYKNGRRKDTKSSSIVFHNEKTYLSVLAYDKEETYNGTLDNVFNLLNDGRIFKDISLYSDFDDYNKIYSIEKTSEKNVKVGDIDTIQFVGNVIGDNGNKCYVYGYTFIMDETPCMLAGCVFSEEQENSSISSMRQEIDTMMKTVRNQ